MMPRPETHAVRVTTWTKPIQRRIQKARDVKMMPNTRLNPSPTRQR
jgi:hypothetical protein